MSLKKLGLLVVTAGCVLSVHAQAGRSHADLRLGKGEVAMERRLQVDREGGTSVPAVVPRPGHHYRHGPWRHRGHRHRHHHLHHPAR